MGRMFFSSRGTSTEAATVEKRDPLNDLAIIKVDADFSAAPLALSTKKLSPGESVFVIGNPAGLDKSISTGVVAGNREIEGRQLIQITAPISHGSSGRPVLDSDGQVVGVTVAMLQDGQNLNFAVPTEKLAQLLAGKTPETTDLNEIFHKVAGLTAAYKQTQYSDDPTSEYQKTWTELHATLQSATILAAGNPELLLEVARRAKDVDADVTLDAAQRATDIKPSVESNLLLGEALKIKAFFVDQPSKDALRQRAENAFHAALKLTKTPTAQLYYDLADVLEDRGSTQDAEVDFHRGLELSRTAGEPSVTADCIRGLLRTTYALQKPTESASWFKMLVDTGAANAWDWQAQAKRLDDEKEYDRAGDAYRNAATLGGFWTNWCDAALDFWIIRDDDALSAARECLSAGVGKKDSEKLPAKAHNIISDILNRRGVYAEALSHAREAVELDDSKST